MGENQSSMASRHSPLVKGQVATITIAISPYCPDPLTFGGGRRLPARAPGGAQQSEIRVEGSLTQSQRQMVKRVYAMVTWPIVDGPQYTFGTSWVRTSHH